MYLRLCIIALMGAAVIGSSSPAYAGNNDGERRDEAKERFAGGHVLFGDESIDPVSAEASALLKGPDLIRWVLEHKGINIANGDFVVGHYTIDNWTYVGVGKFKKKINLPNTYRGWVGWKP